MVDIDREPTGSPEPFPTCSSDRPTATPRVRVLARIRLPLGGPYRPWARLVRFPDGRVLWLVRLWEVDRPVSRLLPTREVRRWADQSGLAALSAALAALEASAREGA